MHLRRKERYKHQTRKDSPSKGWKYSRGCEDSISLQEYVLSQRQVLQCYAKGNSKPDADVENYITTIWTPYANKTLKKIEELCKKYSFDFEEIRVSIVRDEGKIK